MRIGICTSVNHSEILARAGADFVEENVQSFLVPGAAEDAFAPQRVAAQAAGLPVTAANCFLPGALKCVGPAVATEQILAYAGTAFRRAQTVGLNLIVFGSGGSRQVPDGFPAAAAERQFVALLRALGPLAAACGVRIAVEPLGRKECNFINTVEDGAAVVRAAGHPAVRLLVDIYHMRCNDESPAGILANGDLIIHAHVAELAKRTAPGVAGDDLRPWLRALNRVGYRGALSIECGWDNLEQQAGAATRALRQQWDDAQCSS